MTEAWDFVLSCITDSWTWLTSWYFHGVSFGMYLIGFVMLSLLISRLFN